MLDTLTRAGEPISAEELAQRVPDVHPSSVYRALAVLEEAGIAAHVHLGHGPALYQLRDEAADVRYLVCEACGRSIVVPATLFTTLARRLETEHGFVLGVGHFAVVGRCTTCHEPTGDGQAR